ncbi:hypothetical protein CCHR01_14075 [Colletotrichum chrysophilum]|uniref:Uncharacterized protein n=1 Tax=Colletotrichum chrysophilum TaxID=1836956 RepID=A0AAD9AAV9_9PEZI|nr:hypothetical protein CCHR01_14075 [Colletotrichum chrysophilum]
MLATDGRDAPAIAAVISTSLARMLLGVNSWAGAKQEDALRRADASVAPRPKPGFLTSGPAQAKHATWFARAVAAAARARERETGYARHVP